MTAQVLVYSGPAGSGKTTRALAPYLQALRAHQPQSVLWLAPTGHAAAALRNRLLREGLSGCFAPGATTFEQLVQSAVRHVPYPVRPLDDLRRRRLVRHLIAQRLAEERLVFFRPLAELDGLVELVCGTIRGLKRREIGPARYRQLCETRGMTERDAELLDLYEAYQQTLTDNRLFDPEGLLWVAKQAIQQGQWTPLQRLRVVVADGFCDFGGSQHDILEQFALVCDTLVVTLPLEQDSPRPDLWTTPAATLEELRRRHPHLEHIALDRPAQPTWPAMAHLEATLFGNPREATPASDTAGLEILAASRQLGEIELVGSRIRRLLIEGCPRSGGQPVPPEEIAVVFRTLGGDTAPLVREVFGRLGIPLALEATVALERVPALAALLRLMRLVVEDWPFRRLLNVLTSSYFQPDWPEWSGGEAPLTVERAIRRLQVPRGRAELLEQLREELAAGDESVSTALRVLQRLAQVLDELPRRATLGQWAVAWQRLAMRTGLWDVLAREPLADQEAWNQAMESLKADDILFGWMRQSPPELDRVAALASLEDVLANVPVPNSEGDSGRVRVLAAPSVRGLHVPYLFVAGLAEKSFPQSDRPQWLDPSDAEDRNDPQAKHYRDEMLLFYQVLTRATRQLTLSYPALDEAAQPLAPSPYLDEVEQACGVGAIVRTEVPDLTPIPRDEFPQTAAEFRIKALANALEGDSRLMATLVQHESSPGLAENLLAGIRLIRQRQQADRFGPAEGMLQGPAARFHCAEAFGPRRVFSATELEHYAYCPFRYFVDRVLRLRPLDDLELEIDYLARGRIVHEALALFHERVNRAGHGPTSPASLPPEEYARLVEETVQTLFGRHTEGTVRAAMDEIDRRLWTQWIQEYRQQHEQYDALWQECDQRPVPTAFEVSFGLPDGEGGLSTERPLELPCADGTVRISGRIDRIDLGVVRGQPVFNIIDCKSGASARFSLDKVANGTLLQLPLYAMAVQELMLADQKALPWQAGYWELQGDGFKPKNALQMHTCHEGRVQPAAEWEAIRTTVVETIGMLVAAMRDGQFPVYSADEHCTGRCPMKTICRINQIRSLEKQWPATDDQA